MCLLTFILVSTICHQTVGIKYWCRQGWLPIFYSHSLMSNLCYSNILICTTEKDILRDKGWTYYDSLKKCGWKGQVETKEIQGEQHVFHWNNPTCDTTKVLMKWFDGFLLCMGNFCTTIIVVYFLFSWSNNKTFHHEVEILFELVIWIFKNCIFHS